MMSESIITETHLTPTPPFLHSTWPRRDELDRKLQADYTAEVLATARNPVVLISYLTNKPHGDGYKTITGRGMVKVKKPTHVCLSTKSAF